MIKGLADRMFGIADLLTCRLFRQRIELPPRWGLYYERRVTTVALGVNRLHTLTYAF